MTMNANTQKKTRQTSKSGLHNLNELSKDGQLHENPNPPARLDGIGPSERTQYSAGKSAELFDSSAIGDIDPLKQNPD